MEKNMENRTGRGAGEGARRRSLVRNLNGKPGGRGRDGAAAFYIETLALLAAFTVIAMVLVKGFFVAKRLSQEAEALSGAVHLAENAAEMVAASDSGEALLGLLDEAANASVVEQADAAGRIVYRARYDEEMMPAADGIFYVEVSWQPEPGGLVRSTVSVYLYDEETPAYTLDTAVYVERG